MDLPRKNAIPTNILGSLRTLFVSSFTEYIDAQIVVSVTGTKFLKIPLTLEKDNEYFALVELSNDRLQQINGGGMPVIYPFQKPEKGLIYMAQWVKGNNISKLWWIDPATTEIHWPIPDDIKIDFKPIEKPAKVDFLEYSKARGRITIDIKLEAKGLKDNMKVWSVKNFLIPFTELIRTVIVDHNPRLPGNELEKVLNFGYSKIEINCLYSILEFDFNRSLHVENIELENITNLYYLFCAESEEEIIKYLERFQNKKLIPQYLSMLRQIIKNKATLNSKVATPAGHYQEAFFNRQRSVNIKKIMDNKLPTTAYEENVIGVLTRLDFQTSSIPRFALHSTTDNQVYCGIIDPALDKSIPEVAINFKEKEYDCKLKVIFSPESTGNAERYDYILLGITDMDRQNQTEIIPKN